MALMIRRKMTGGVVAPRFSRPSTLSQAKSFASGKIKPGNAIRRKPSCPCTIPLRELDCLLGDRGPTRGQSPMVRLWRIGIR